MNIVPRSVWGARYADGQGNAPVPADRVYLHHTVTRAPTSTPENFTSIRTLEDIGQSRFGYGISYTFIVMPDGSVFQGHSVGRIGTHTGGHNTASRAISLVGNYQDNPVPSKMVEAVANLLVHGFLSGWWKEPKIAGGHRDVRPTSCPGDRAYALIPSINASASDILRRITSAPSTSSTPTTSTKSHTVVAGDTLGTIANRYGVHVESIVRINGIVDPNRIYVGQIIYLEHQAPPSSTNTSTSETVTVNLTLPILRVGAKGHHVIMAQSMINAHGIGTTADGQFGPQTEKSVKAFQRTSNISVTGQVDAKDWKQLLRG